MKQGYITLLSTENYLEGVLVLAVSLRQAHSQYPLIVAITENLSKNDYVIQSLKKFNCLIEILPLLEYSNVVKKDYENHSVLNTASKIGIFRLTNWDKLVYIDADVMVIKNLDFVFNFPDGSMLYTPLSIPKFGTTSLFVFEPKNHQEVEFLEHLICYANCFDGDLLGKLWFHVPQDPRYQIPFETLKDYSFPFDDTNVCAIHFVNQPKPWINFDRKVFKFGPYILQYENYLKTIRQKLNN